MSYQVTDDTKEDDRENTPKTLQKQIDKAVGGWKTTSSKICAVVGGFNTSGKLVLLFVLTT